MKITFFIFGLMIVFTLLFMPPSIYALSEQQPGPCIDDGMGNAVCPGVKKKSSSKTYEDIMNSLFGLGPINNQQRNITPTQSPQTTLTPGATTPTQIPNTPVGKSFKYYRQCDYRSTRLRDGGPECTMCKAGCGITSAAGVLSTLKDPSLDPPTVLKRYTELGLSSGCGGTRMTDAKRVVESYGLVTSATYLFQNNSPGYTIDEVADDIRQKVKNGWYVFVLANFCSGGCGHFFVITDIDSANNVTSFDPYYFDSVRYPPASTSQPITYSRIKPYPRYRYAFAVRGIASTISQVQ